MVKEHILSFNKWNRLNENMEEYSKDESDLIKICFIKCDNPNEDGLPDAGSNGVVVEATLSNIFDGIESLVEGPVSNWKENLNANINDDVNPQINLAQSLMGNGGPDYEHLLTDSYFPLMQFLLISDANIVDKITVEDPRIEDGVISGVYDGLFAYVNRKR